MWDGWVAVSPSNRRPASFASSDVKRRSTAIRSRGCPMSAWFSRFPTKSIRLRQKVTVFRQQMYPSCLYSLCSILYSLYSIHSHCNPSPGLCQEWMDFPWNRKDQAAMTIRICARWCVGRCVLQIITTIFQLCLEMKKLRLEMKEPARWKDETPGATCATIRENVSTRLLKLFHWWWIGATHRGFQGDRGYPAVSVFFPKSVFFSRQSGLTTYYKVVELSFVMESMNFCCKMDYYWFAKNIIVTHYTALEKKFTKKINRVDDCCV